MSGTHTELPVPPIVHTFKYACECGARSCSERIRLTSFQYDRMRKEGLILSPACAPRRVLERGPHYALAPAGRML